MIGVAIVASVPALRAGLRALLEASGEIRVVEEASSPAELELPPEVEVVVAVLEPAAREAARRRWQTLGAERAVLFLVEGPEPVQMLSSLSLPVYGVLPLGAPPETLRAAVRALREGLIVLAPGLVGSSPLPRELPAAEEELMEPLTPREIEVLRLLSLGLANKEIAARLGISEHTVKFHLSAIYSKLGAANRAEAVRRGLQRGLIPL
ncbi:Transcriptional regulatory protein LiaR [Candidatus Thermoflexus japonica]|uniref:Transcriptional regulatory protein LiaR n=1 Tax=Candidatus Thermoflexus japonica TaxID=2035417 RepID=A0A2H5YA79_9CHLR|nr:Transcriptional regulatory protein LiaR [Candidatus Thermoflexus japonica]